MRDVFYFTKSPVSLSDIASIAREFPREPEIIQTSGGEILNIYGPDNELIHWIPLDPLGRDFSSFEIPEQERIRAYQPAVGFIASYHLPSTEILVKILKRLLERHGGWVGGDDHNFEPIYNLETIEALAGKHKVAPSKLGKVG